MKVAISKILAGLFLCQSLFMTSAYAQAQKEQSCCEEVSNKIEEIQLKISQYKDWIYETNDFIANFATDYLVKNSNESFTKEEIDEIKKGIQSHLIDYKSTKHYTKWSYVSFGMIGGMGLTSVIGLTTKSTKIRKISIGGSGAFLLFIFASQIMNDLTLSNERKQITALNRVFQDDLVELDSLWNKLLQENRELATLQEELAKLESQKSCMSCK